MHNNTELLVHCACNSPHSERLEALLFLDVALHFPSVALLTLPSRVPENHIQAAGFLLRAPSND